MTKKAKREITEAVPAESGKVSEKKKLTRKHKIIIAVAVIVLAAIIALSVALPLTLGRDGTPEPYFLFTSSNTIFLIVFLLKNKY